MFPNHSPAELYNGQRPNPIPTPLVGSFSAIGHIAALEPDTAVLKPGQLAYIGCAIRVCDDPDSFFLSAIYEGFSEGSRKLMRDVWRDETFAEYAKVPLENCIPLNEARLCGRLRYSLPDLVSMGYLAVPYGELRGIGLEAGETVIVCPATGFYSGFGVQIAAAVGASVIAMGRSGEKLVKLKEEVKRGLVARGGD